MRRNSEDNKDVKTIESDRKEFVKKKKNGTMTQCVVRFVWVFLFSINFRIEM